MPACGEGAPGAATETARRNAGLSRPNAADDDLERRSFKAVASVALIAASVRAKADALLTASSGASASTRAEADVDAGVEEEAPALARSVSDLEQTEAWLDAAVRGFEGLRLENDAPRARVEEMEEEAAASRADADVAEARAEAAESRVAELEAEEARAAKDARAPRRGARRRAHRGSDSAANAVRAAEANARARAPRRPKMRRHGSERRKPGEERSKKRRRRPPPRAPPPSARREGAKRRVEGARGSYAGTAAAAAAHEARRIAEEAAARFAEAAAAAEAEAAVASPSPPPLIFRRAEAATNTSPLALPAPPVEDVEDVEDAEDAARRGREKTHPRREVNDPNARALVLSPGVDADGVGFSSPRREGGGKFAEALRHYTRRLRDDVRRAEAETARHRERAEHMRAEIARLASDLPSARAKAAREGVAAAGGDRRSRERARPRAARGRRRGSRPSEAKAARYKSIAKKCYERMKKQKVAYELQIAGLRQQIECAGLASLNITENLSFASTAAPARAREARGVRREDVALRDSTDEENGRRGGGRARG